MDYSEVLRIAPRFWPRVAKAPECWEWTGAHVPEGYGSISIRGSSQVGAHRIAWSIANGEWPPPGMVLHKCGNRGCVRPDHLYVGDARQNAADARRHGTLAQGEKHGNTKEDDGAVAEIRRRYATGETQSAIARDFAITQAQVSNIVRGVQRGGLAVEPPALNPRYSQTCEQCGAVHYRKPGARPSRFCSRACQSQAQRRDSTRHCAFCGTEFYRPPSAKGETCSYRCMGALRSHRFKSR